MVSTSSFHISLARANHLAAQLSTGKIRNVDYGCAQEKENMDLSVQTCSVLHIVVNIMEKRSTIMELII